MHSSSSLYMVVMTGNLDTTMYLLSLSDTLPAFCAIYSVNC